EDGIRDKLVTGVQTCALPIYPDAESALCLVHQAKRALGIGIGKVPVEVGDLWREQQTFVNDGATRQRRNVEKFFVFDVRLGYLRSEERRVGIECRIRMLWDQK